MKNEKGFTYIATIIWIIIIVVLVIGIIYYIQLQYQNEESETIKTNMLAIQGKAKIVAEEEKALNKELIGTKISIEERDTIELLKSQNIEIEEESKYYILRNEDLITMGIGNINLKPDEYYIVNYDDLEVIYSNGIKTENNRYYKLSDFINLNEEKEIVKENEIQ